MLRIIDILKRNKIFEQYQKETFNMIKIDEINNLKIDKVIVGSDQVWNFELTDYDMNYFLPFVNEFFFPSIKYMFNYIFPFLFIIFFLFFSFFLF